MRLSWPSAALAAGALLLAGCGSAAAPTPPAAPTTSAAVTGGLSVAGSAATGQAAWAILPMGAVSGANLFWQLFALSAGGTWRLDTPPDIATNGAPALASVAGTGLITGVRPSLHLTYSPLSETTDAGLRWTAGPPAAALASVPDALAGTDGGNQLLDLSTSGRVTTGSFSGSAWRTFATEASVAGSAPGRACGVTALTAVAYTPSGGPLVGGSCSRPGVAGIFSRSGSAVTAAGPALPASLSGMPVRVLRLMTDRSATMTLVQAGTGQSAIVLAGWRDAAGKWTVSAALPLRGATVRTSAFSASGSVGVLLSDGKGATVLSAGAGRTWQDMPTLPSVPGERSATFAFPAGQQPELLTASAGTMTAWQLATSGRAWSRIQTVKVPIQYGSSG